MNHSVASLRKSVRSDPGIGGRFDRNAQKARLAQAGISRPVVGKYSASGLYILTDEGQEGCRRGIRHMHDADPSKWLFLLMDGMKFSKFHGDNYNGLLKRLPPSHVRFLTSDKRLIDLDSPSESVPIGANHCTAQFMQPGPCRFVAANSQKSLHSLRASSGFLRANPPHRPKPVPQGLARPMEDRSRGRRDMLAAIRADQQPTTIGPGLASSAPRTPETFGPSYATEKLVTGLFRRKPGVELGKCFREVFEERIHAGTLPIGGT